VLQCKIDKTTCSILFLRTVPLLRLNYPNSCRTKLGPEKNTRLASVYNWLHGGNGNWNKINLSIYVQHPLEQCCRLPLSRITGTATEHNTASDFATFDAGLWDPPNAAWLADRGGNSRGNQDLPSGTKSATTKALINWWTGLAKALNPSKRLPGA
jgi:hypothetical protein